MIGPIVYPMVFVVTGYIVLTGCRVTAERAGSSCQQLVHRLSLGFFVREMVRGSGSDDGGVRKRLFGGSRRRFPEPCCELSVRSIFEPEQREPLRSGNWLLFRG